MEIAEHDRNTAGERGKVHRSVGVALSVAEARAGGGTTSACSKRFLVAGSGVLPVQNGCTGKMDLAQVLSRTGGNCIKGPKKTTEGKNAIIRFVTPRVCVMDVGHVQ